MRFNRMIKVVGCHAEGEVGDVIVGGILPPPGETVFEQSRAFERDQDHLRRLLICEPRGSVARHVNLIVPPKRSDCVAGAIIMEPTEYPPMSGSNTICIVTVLLETGMVPMIEPVTRLRLDMPAGPVDVEAECRDGKCIAVKFENVPCFAHEIGVPLTLETGETITIDIAYGGMIYALAEVSQFGLSVAPEHGRRLAEIGEAIRRAARRQYPDVMHPENPEIRGVSIVQLHEAFTGVGGASRNTCIVAPGRCDRSPTGTGLSARLAVLHAKGLLKAGDSFAHDSIIGSRFEGKIERETTIAGRPAIIPSIRGRAWITGFSDYVIDPTDPYPAGYVISDTWGTSTKVTQD